MSSQSQFRIIDALAVPIRHLARILLRAGISYKDFSEVAKKAFVEVAAEDYGVRGRPTNASRIAVMTGLGRKEIKKILDDDSATPSGEIAIESPASVVLYRWHNHPDFSTSDGKPRLLEYDGCENSFVDLVKRFGGDIPPGAMRTELTRVGAIEITDEGKIQALERTYLPMYMDDRLIFGLEEFLSAAIDTLSFNCNLLPGQKGRMECLASVDNIAEEYIPAVKHFATEHIEKLASEFCSYATEFEQEETRLEKNKNQVGVGLFYYELHSAVEIEKGSD